ncbi:hypothetical protein [Halobacillus amylolyticus]|uniref:Helix-turn-helix domain-containing protein n=1 Tax=Halobacillus amylolyticus TaxID=2932259 RepID=A0ABY4HE44_9BACI|nr:hypothetical protein [Halobacillus amylolyticus]UOR12180.1 hypothetical protein MUO15_01180 [Halobacillus amylolyticus]
MFTSGEVKKFKKLSQFKDIEGFNNSFEQHMVDHKDSFTKSEMVALRRLVRFSCKVAGVCYAKIQTIVSATHEKGDLGGISRSSFERMLRKAKKLNIVSVHNTMRKGKKGHNVYVFNRYKSVKQKVVSFPSNNEVVNDEKIDVSKTSNLLESINPLKERKGFENHLSHQYVSSNIPKQLTNTVRSHFDCAETIYKVWNRLTLATRKQGSEWLKFDYIEEYAATYREVIDKYKQKRIRGDLFGYLYGSFCNKTGEIIRRLNADKSVLFSMFKEVFEEI